MSPLMQIICDQLRFNDMNRYIDGFQRDTYTMELKQLYGALSAALPKSCRELLQHYTLTLNAYALMELEAMFQAAFSAARELD